MKITNFNTGLKWNNQHEKASAGSGQRPDNTPVYRKASGGEDFLEISDEAVKRHKEAKILSFEDGRRRKEVRDAAVIINSLIISDGIKVERIRDMIADNRYDFNDVKILGETAERIIEVIE